MGAPAMRYRSLGRCGTKVSVFGLGGWLSYGGSVTDRKAVRTILHAAFDAGINFFDIADVYSGGEAERVMGRVLADRPRHELVISSKLFFAMSDDVNDRGLSRKHIFESIDKSLRRIGTDYLDIYFCHRFDEDTPIEETARAMDDLIRRGKVLYWGTSGPGPSFGTFTRFVIGRTSTLPRSSSRSTACSPGESSRTMSGRQPSNTGWGWCSGARCAWAC